MNLDKTVSFEQAYLSGGYIYMNNLHQFELSTLTMGDNLLHQKCSSSGVLGPFSEKELLDTGLMVNHFGVILKDSSGKWCLIMDLSFPKGAVLMM